MFRLQHFLQQMNILQVPATIFLYVHKIQFTATQQKPQDTKMEERTNVKKTELNKQ